MGTSTSLEAAAAKIVQAVGPATTKAMAAAAGMAAKKAALTAAAGDLGGDRRMSGFRRIGALNAGYDIHGDSVTVNYRPPGAWMLAERGRRGSKRVTVKRKRVKARAFRTPEGPRAAFTSGRSRGLNTLTTAQREGAKDGVKAADKAFGASLTRIF